MGGSGHWLRYDGFDWCEDSTVAVSSVTPLKAPMTPLKVKAPVVKHCEGVYELVVDAAPNGYPLWKQEDGEHWLFSSIGERAGRWMIGDSEEQEKGFACDTGIISSAVLHHSKLPDSLGI